MTYRSHPLYPRWDELSTVILTGEPTEETYREFLALDAKLRELGVPGFPKVKT